MMLLALPADPSHRQDARGGCRAESVIKRSEPELTDENLQSEIELLGDVIAAASLSQRPLTEAELDEALGLPHPHPRVDESAPQP
jgi:hypothetical protein